MSDIPRINGENYSLFANDLCLYVVAYAYDEALQNMPDALNQFHLYLYTLAISPSFGGS